MRQEIAMGVLSHLKGRFAPMGEQNALFYKRKKNDSEIMFKS